MKKYVDFASIQFEWVSLRPSFFAAGIGLYNHLGQDSSKPDIARNDHHRTKQNITANEIDK
jgi:hypothetical protein